MSEKILKESFLYDFEEGFGSLYITTVRQLRRLSITKKLSEVANAAELDPEIVRKLCRGNFNKPFVGHIEALNRAMNNGELVIK